VFTPAILRGSPEIFGFLEQNVLKQLPRYFEADATADEHRVAVTKILVLPGAADGGTVSLAKRGAPQRARGRCDHLVPRDADRPDRQDRKQPELQQERHPSGHADFEKLRSHQGLAARSAGRAGAGATRKPRADFIK